jgi:pimeloyl-ACP methyl ester carboxylesterase
MKTECRFAMAFAMAFAAATAVAADAPTDPLVIKEQGSFFVDGESVFTENAFGDPSHPLAALLDAPGHITVNQMYVEYQIPQDAGRHVPVVLIHGGDLSGVTYETTPDGRMGWEEYFARQDRPVYVPDQVSRARSGFDVRAINAVKKGLQPVSDLPLVFVAPDEVAWTLFRFGPEFGTPFADTKFPVEAADEFSKQVVPDFNLSLPEPNPTIGHLAELATDKLKGAILLGHSQSGLFPLDVALINLDAVKGAIVIEPGGCNNSVYTDQQINTLTGVPILVMFGDHIADFSFWQDNFNDCDAFVQRVNDAGGNATMLHPPDLGIFGNTHMLMQDENNLQLADLILKWIDQNVE